MTKLMDITQRVYETEKPNDNFEYKDFDISLLSNELPPELQQKLNQSLQKNEKLNQYWNNEVEKPSRSEKDMGVTFQLKSEGYSVQEIGHILCHYPHGKGRDLDAREVVRNYNRCDSHIHSATEEFESLSEEYLNRIAKQTNPIIKVRKSNDNINSNNAILFRSIPLSKMDWRYVGAPIYKNMIYEKLFSVMYGQSNVGKSFVATDMAGHIALKRAWAGVRFKPTEPIGIVYICAEAGKSFGKRGKALLNRLEVEELPFYVIDASPNFAKSKDDAKGIVREIKRIEQERNIMIGLVVVDTLATTFEGGNENSSEDMGLYISNMKWIQRYADTGVLIVHHSGKDQAAGARGHSSLRAATDTEIEITAEKAGKRYNRKIIVKKQREGEGDKTIEFALKVLKLGKDDDGETIDTCYVVLETDSEFEAVSILPEDRYTGTTQAAFLTLKRFQEHDFLKCLQGKKSTEIRKLMIKYWFLIKNTPKKTLLFDDLQKADASYYYEHENSNFNRPFNKIKEHFDYKEIKLDQWINDNLVKPSQTLST